MKKIFLFLLIATLSVTLAGCSWFDNEPIKKPNIIGNGCLHFEPKSGLWLVEVDSVKYAVNNVIVYQDKKIYGKKQKTAPAEGMLVTVFVYQEETGIQAASGKQTAEQIEKLYNNDSPLVLILLLVLFLCFCGSAFRHGHKS